MASHLLVPDSQYQRSRIFRKTSERPECLWLGRGATTYLNILGSDFILYGKIGQCGMWKTNPGRLRIKEIGTYELAWGLQAGTYLE